MSNEFLNEITKIQECQATIDVLLNHKLVNDKDGNTESCWTIRELEHIDEEYNVGIAESDSKTLTEFPLHKHPSSKEYLICVKGRVLVSLAGNTRILEVGECVSLPEGIVHKSTPLQAPSKLLYICIPNDKGFKGSK